MDLRPECEALSEMLLNLGKLSVNNVHDLSLKVEWYFKHWFTKYTWRSLCKGRFGWYRCGFGRKKDGHNVILILGSEGFGVSKDVTNNLTNYNVYIPPRLNKSKINHHPFDLIDSLNVGVSAGIILNNIAAQLKNNEQNEIKI